jgi:hypothetical protein
VLAKAMYLEKPNQFTIWNGQSNLVSLLQIQLKGKTIVSKKSSCKESKNQHIAFLPKDYKLITVSQVCDRI